MNFIIPFRIKPGWLAHSHRLHVNLVAGLLIIFLQITRISTGAAQIHQKQWDKTLGGSDSDVPAAVVPTEDGGFLLAGTTYSDAGYDVTDSTRGLGDYWIIKTDSSGNKLWDKRFGGDNYDYLSSAIQTRDGGFLLAGSSASSRSGDVTQDSTGLYDYWIIRIDRSGNKLWDKRYGGNLTDELRSVLPTNDGGYLLGGTSESGISGDKTQDNWGIYDFWIIKIDSTGTQLWDKRFGGTGIEFFTAAIQTQDNGFLVVGTSESPMSGDLTSDSRGLYDYWVIKTDDTGNKLWDKRFGGADNDFSAAVLQTEAGDFMLAGTSYSLIGGDKTEDSRGLSDYWLVKISSSGSKLWDKRFGGDYLESLSVLTVTEDGGYLLAGSSGSNSGGDKSEGNRGINDYWIVKTDSAGNKSWDKRFGGDNYDNISAAVQTGDGGFLLAGISNSDENGDKSERGRYAPGSGNYGDFWIVKTYPAPPIAEPYFIMQDTTVTTCSGTFFDPGFTALYPDSVDYTQTFLPGISGNKIRVVFSFIEFPSIDFFANNDFLYIYDGASVSSPLIGVFSATTPAPDTVTASNPQGALTFRFVSDEFWTAPGWQADITCMDSDSVQAPFISALWNKRFGGDAFDYLNAALQTSDGGFLLGGISNSFINGDKSEPGRGFSDYWVVKTDSAGTKLWDKTFGGDGNDILKALIETPDGGYLLVGDSFSPVSGDKTAQNHGPRFGTEFTPDIWLVKTDKDGNKLWDKTLGGDNYEYINSIIRTRDGNCLIAGASNSGISGDKSQDSRGGFDYWVIKIDAEGNILWDKRFGGSNDEYMYVMIENNKNGFLLGGMCWSDMTGDKSQPTWGVPDYWVIEIDGQGNKLWDKRFGGTAGDYLLTGLQTEDGGYLLGGDSESGLSGDRTQESQGSFDYWMVKINGSGNKLWDRRYGGNSYDGNLRSLIQSEDGGYLLAGNSFSDISGDKAAPSKGSSDYWLLKTDRFGNKLWDKTFGGTAEDRLNAAVALTDGSLLLAGFSFSGIGTDKSEDSRGVSDYWIVKTTPEIYLPAPFLVNFQDKLTRTPQGWTKDYGLPFGEQNIGEIAYTFGWKNRSTETPIDLSGNATLSGNGRKRPAPADVLLASLMHMQGNDVKNFRGTPVESYWEIAVENGEYQVSVSVGDGSNYTATDPESHSIQVEGIAAITGFIPQGGNGNSSRFAQATVRVNVTDGLLTLVADGGTNTKINYAIIQPLGRATVVQKQAAVVQAAESLPTTGQAFPNPFTDQVSIRLNAEMGGSLSVTVQDMTGNIHYQTQLANQRSVVSLDLSSVALKTGVYMVTVTTESGLRQTIRIIKR